jgi:CheY-like chemotaxis protein
MAEATTYDVILCDIGMPGLNGYEVAKELRTRLAIRAQLIAVTGYAAPDDVARAREAGFDAHVPKPPDPNKLLRLLK